MKIPPYYTQEHPHACSLAVLRMVLAYYNIKVSERELITSVERTYGSNFNNIWNPTIARIACEYSIQTIMYANWSVFGANSMNIAMTEHFSQASTFTTRKYKNSPNKENPTESMSVPYKEVVLAVQGGCKTEYGALTTHKIRSLLKEGYIVQTSVKLILYPGKKGYHSILIYGATDDGFIYHDPSFGNSLLVDNKRLTQSISNVGVGIVYRIDEMNKHTDLRN